jgi:hypothetical protein
LKPLLRMSSSSLLQDTNKNSRARTQQLGEGLIKTCRKRQCNGPDSNA